METIAKHRHARSSAQKVRLVADLIRGKKVSQALDILPIRTASGFSVIGLSGNTRIQILP